jgi:hypothetical protein
MRHAHRVKEDSRSSQHHETNFPIPSPGPNQRVGADGAKNLQILDESDSSSHCSSLGIHDELTPPRIYGFDYDP